MTEVYIIDTNVWVMAEKFIGDVTTQTELDCIQACKKWLKGFTESTAIILLDDQYKVLTEYRRYVREGTLSSVYLSRLEAQPRERLLEITIQFDEDGYAVVPDILLKFDNEDKKWVALALAYTPTPPIFNAVDTDWVQWQDTLRELGITVHELCKERILEMLNTVG
jgi:hypothetical protein